MDYLGYTVEDFLMDSGFCNYCLRRDEADIAFWEDWLRRYPEKKVLVDQAEALFRILNGNLPGEEFERNYNQFAQTLDRHILQSGLYTGALSTRPLHKKVWRITGMISMAAAIVVGLTVGAYWLLSPAAKPLSHIDGQAGRGLVEEMNTTSGHKTLFLEDGSKVLLSSRAKISFPRHFEADRREVYLEGEAYFDVVKNSGRPFFVYDSNLVTEVLGTSFTIRTANGKIEVSVHTGRVAVFENGRQTTLSGPNSSENGVIVTRNQRVTYYTGERHFVSSLVDSPVAFAAIGQTADSTFVFDDAPLSRVLRQLEKSFGIEIVLENDDLNKCPFTGNISKQTLYKKLDVVTAAFQASYEVKGTRILIKGGRGCH